MQLALRAVGVRAGEPVLTNAFTLAPVPGAIHAVGAQPVFVEVTSNLVIDLDDLALKAQESGASVLLLSHMRGHLVDMQQLLSVTDALGIVVIEDCAHTMGAEWDGKKSGNFGAFGCFSTQTYKHMNSGEGGFLTSNDASAMASAVIMSGSYANFDRHAAVPAVEHFEDAQYQFANMSARMDALRAAVLRPQLEALDDAIREWNWRYEAIARVLRECSDIRLPEAADASCRVGSSLQFSVPGFDHECCELFLQSCAASGVDLKWFGGHQPKGYTSTHAHWRYAPLQRLPRTDLVLSTLFDFRIPLTFNQQDCSLLATIISQGVKAFSGGALR
jgi:dTDP-4-amino-4,6-dideoxygalactose transaminase